MALSERAKELVVELAKDNVKLGDTPIFNFEDVKHSIAVRIRADDVFVYPHIYKMGVWRRDFDGTLSVLVYDYPTHVALVPKSHVEAWRIPVDELFELGINNVIANFPAMVDALPEYGIYFLGSDDVYVTTYIYRLADFPELIGRYGSLVSIPERHTVVILPLNGSESSKSFPVFINLTLGLFSDMEIDDPITYHAWWYYQGGFSRADIVVDNMMYLLLPNWVLEDCGAYG